MSNRSAAERIIIEKEAEQALSLLDTHVQEDMHGDIDGIDTIDAGLRAMASALQKLFDVPMPEGMRKVYIEDVLDYLASTGRVDHGASRIARLLQRDITTAMYHGIDDAGIDAINERREQLYEVLEELLGGTEKDDGS